MPIRYVPYIREPVEGQALLDVITRTRRMLRYRENGAVIERLERGMPLYELEELETVGAGGDNLLIRGECVSACAYLKEGGVKVDLVYIDPPFASGADYAKKVYLRRNPHKAEELAAAEQELDNDELRAFEETMYGDIWRKEDYLNWMFENLSAIRSVMSETGSVYVHLDSSVGHYVKILMDEIFGEDNFVNEIIWKRQTAKGDVTQGARHMGRIHETIFLYALSDDYTWNIVHTPYDQSYIDAFYRHQDEDGRRYRLSDTTAPGKAGKGNPYYEFLGIKRYYRFSREKMQALYEQGKIVQTSPGAVPAQKRYLDEMPGVPLQSLWTDVQAVQAQADERLDYPTQKPEALLERIIKASSNEGMVVADFFGGSGVTAKVAHDLGRRFVHVDVGINSIQTARDRLKEAGAGFQILEIKDGVSLFRNPQQTMDKLARLIPGLQRGVPGLDKFWFGAIQDSKLGTVPVYVPNLLEGKQKVLDIPAVNRVINEAVPELDESVRQVVVYYVDMDDEAALEKFVREHNATRVKVELRDLKNVLHQVVVEDIVQYACERVGDEWVVRVGGFISDRLNGKLAEFNEKGNLQALKKGSPFAPIAVSEEGLELIELVALDCENAAGPWLSSSEVKIDKKGYAIRNGEKTREVWDGTVRLEKKPLRLKVRNISGDETVLDLNCRAS